MEPAASSALPSGRRERDARSLHLPRALAVPQPPANSLFGASDPSFIPQVERGGAGVTHLDAGPTHPSQITNTLKPQPEFESRLCCSPACDLGIGI
jgi:hypothetical protein